MVAGDITTRPATDLISPGDIKSMNWSGTVFFLDCSNSITDSMLMLQCSTAAFNLAFTITSEKTFVHNRSLARSLVEVTTDLEALVHGELDVNGLRADPRRHVLIIVHHLLSRRQVRHLNQSLHPPPTVTHTTINVQTFTFTTL